MALQVVARGFPGTEDPLRPDPSLADDFTALAAVRDAVGNRLELMVDCNQGWRMPWDTAAPWTVSEALEVARELEKQGVYWMEEPLHRGDYDGYAALRRATTLRIAGGEMTRERYEFDQLLAHDCLDVFQPDVACSLGMEGLRKLAQAVETRGKVFTPHTWGNGIGLVANLHLTAGAASAPFIEFPYDPPEWSIERRDFMLTQPIDVDSEGWLTLSDEPGLGLTIDEDVPSPRRKVLAVLTPDDVSHEAHTKTNNGDRQCRSNPGCAPPAWRLPPAPYCLPPRTPAPGARAARPCTLPASRGKAVRSPSEVLRYIAEKGYGCKTDTVPGSTAATETALARNDLQVWGEQWTGRSEIIAKGVADGQGQADRRHAAGRHQRRLVRAGIRHQGRPGARHQADRRRTSTSVADLPKYKDLFEDDEEPGKGRFLNCPAGWDCERVNSRLLKVLKLDDSYTNFRPGTGAALDAAISSAYQRGKPILFYYWEPAALMAKYKFVATEDAAVRRRSAGRRCVPTAARRNARRRTWSRI